jgi:ribose transport system permease protein
MNRTKRVKITRPEIIVFAGRYGTIICLLGMIIFFSILLPGFRSTNNLMNLLGQTTILSIFAAGMTCSLKMGDFDLSIVAILCGLLTGGLIGLINGVFVAYVGLSAFVCTLATMSIVLGFCMAITKGISIWNLPEAFSFIGRGDLFGLPIRFVIMICLLFILWFIHNYTPTGRRMEAIGGNAVSAQLSGIKVERNRLLGYLLSDICAAIAGIVLTSSSMTANAVQGSHYLLDAFGAAFIGAATIRIGQFHIWGTFIGVLIVVVAINGLVILMVPGYFTDMIKGIILLLAIMLSGAIGKFFRV